MACPLFSDASWSGNAESLAASGSFCEMSKKGFNAFTPGAPHVLHQRLQQHLDRPVKSAQFGQINESYHIAPSTFVLPPPLRVSIDISFLLSPAFGVRP